MRVYFLYHGPLLLPYEIPQSPLLTSPLAEGLGRAGKTGRAEPRFQTEPLLPPTWFLSGLEELSCFLMAAIMPLPKSSRAHSYYFSCWRLLKVKSRPGWVSRLAHRFDAP